MRAPGARRSCHLAAVAGNRRSGAASEAVQACSAPVASTATGFRPSSRGASFITASPPARHHPERWPLMTGIRRPGLVCEEAISARISRIRFLQVSHLPWLQCRTLHPNSHCERSGGTAAIKGPVHTLLNHLNIFAILSPCFRSGHRSAHPIVCHRPWGSSSIEELAGYCFIARTLTILRSNFLAHCLSAQFIDDHGTRPTRAHTSLLYVADRGIYVTTRVAVRSSFLSPVQINVCTQQHDSASIAMQSLRHALAV